MIIAQILGNLGGPVIVAIVMCILGLVFGAGFKKSFRGGIYTAIGLAGLFVIVNNATTVLTPAIQAFAERLNASFTAMDVGWGSAGVAFAWPGLAFVILGTLLVNLILVLLKVVKTMWTDVWSLWHGQVVGGMVWFITGGNTWLGVAAAVLFLTANSFVGDYTAKKYQEFNELPGISVPCTVTFLAIFARPFNWLIEKIPGIRKIDASPEAIRSKMGVFGELGVMGLVIGIIIGILGGLPYGQVLNMGIQAGLLMVFLPKTVSILCEGVIPISNSVMEYVQEKFGGRQLYVAVDCAALLGHPSVMASAVILYPLVVLLAVILPGNALLPIASLAIIPYWCGAVAPYFKGNVFRIVLFILIWTIPVLYIASAMAPIHTGTMAALQLADGNILNSCFDMAGDPLGALVTNIFSIFK